MNTRVGDNPISVSLSRALVPYLNQKEDNSYHKRAGDIMMASFAYMMGKQEYSTIDRYEVWFRDNHWVNLTVPGDRCGLDPSGYYKSDQGYTIYPHNVDSVAQQLTLLMGIAAVHQEARELGF